MTNRRTYILEVEPLSEALIRVQILEGDFAVAIGIGNTFEVAVNIATAAFKAHLANTATS